MALHQGRPRYEFPLEPGTAEPQDYMPTEQIFTIPHLLAWKTGPAPDEGTPEGDHRIWQRRQYLFRMDDEEMKAARAGSSGDDSRYVVVDRGVVYDIWTGEVYDDLSELNDAERARRLKGAADWELDIRTQARRLGVPEEVHLEEAKKWWRDRRREALDPRFAKRIAEARKLSGGLSWARYTWNSKMAAMEAAAQARRDAEEQGR